MIERAPNGNQNMNRLRIVGCATIAAAMLTGATATDATKHVVRLNANDVTLRTDPDTTVGAYYTVSYSPPAGLNTDNLDRAILELYLDVSAKARDEYVNEAPVFEVYALKEPFVATLDPELLDRDTRSSRPIAAGLGRRVVIDVTSIVRAHLQGTVVNNGIVIGSLTGMREGQFTILSGKLPEGAVGQLLMFRRHQFAPDRP